MKHLKQTKRSNCGQTCMAMLADKTIEEVETALGKRGCTSGTDFRKLLPKLRPSICLQERMILMSKELLDKIIEGGGYSIALILMIRPKEKSKKGHWVVLSGKHVYDPAFDNKVSARWYLKRLSKQNRRVTSYMVVEDFILMEQGGYEMVN